MSRASTYVGRMQARAHAVRSQRPDLAHVIYLNPFIDALSLPSIARRAPLVSSVHDVVPHQRRMPAPVQRRALEREYADLMRVRGLDIEDFTFAGQGAHGVEGVHGSSCGKGWSGGSCWLGMARYW